MKLKILLKRKRELLEDNRWLMFEVAELQKQISTLQEQIHLTDAYGLTEMVHPSCRGCAKAAWMIGPWDELVFVGCTKDNPCAEFIPETKLVWCSSGLKERHQGLPAR